MSAKPKSNIISQKLRASYLSVLVESEIKHEIFNQKIDF